MPMDFPTAPTVGQTYNGYIYDGTKWKASPTSVAPSVVSATPPTNPTVGDMWFNSTDGTMYFYYNDGNTSQWVESRAPIVANGYYSPNYIINGAFEINQRGFTSTVTDGTYGFDRFRYEGAVGSPAGTITMSAQAFTAGTAPVAGYEGKNFLRLVTTGLTGGTVFASIRQPIEDVRTLAGQTATISFWAKAASGTPYIEPVFYQYFGTGGSSTVKTFGGKQAITTSWARYTFTVTLPSVAGKTIIDANSSLSLYIFMADSGVIGTTLGLQNNTFDIWGVQVEAGSVATTFRRNGNSIAEELSACERYFQSFTAGTVVGTSPPSFLAYKYFSAPTATRMRALPTASATSLRDSYTGAVLASNPTVNVDGQAYVWTSSGSNSSSGWNNLVGLQLNAEL